MCIPKKSVADKPLDTFFLNPKHSRMKNTYILPILYAFSAIFAAYVLGAQIASWRVTDKTVQVRGAAELPVQADLATWTLGVTGADDDVVAAQGKVTADIARIKAYLVKAGVPEADLENQNITVSDARANQYNQAVGPRFSVQGGVLVRTTKLEAIQKARQNLDKLVGQGVVLTSSWGPNFAFTRLNAFKPQLLSAATAEALKAAQQFATDSGAQVGGIRRARQGNVEVLGRDEFAGESEQIHKRLRLVTTVEYDVR